MSKTSEALFPGEYSRSEMTQNLNELVRDSSFATDAIGLAIDFASDIDKKIPQIGDCAIDSMTTLFTLCSDYEIRYQAIIKKALDEALAKIKAKNDLEEIQVEMITSHGSPKFSFPFGTEGEILLTNHSGQEKKYVFLEGKWREDTTFQPPEINGQEGTMIINDFIPNYNLDEPSNTLIKMYVLNELGEPVLENDISKWNSFMFEEPKNRIVEQTDLGDYFISTVFLGIDHNFLGDKPILWETMVFKGDSSEDIKCKRYSSIEDARKGHAKYVNKYTLKEPK